jgi:uncharacterized protein YcnI
MIGNQILWQTGKLPVVKFLETTVEWQLATLTHEIKLFLILLQQCCKGRGSLTWQTYWKFLTKIMCCPVQRVSKKMSL